jgi:hypothetical protein
MPGSDLPDFRTPSPDEGHEAIRAPLAQAIDDLADAVGDLDNAKLGVDDAYFLTDLLFDLLDGVMAASGELTVRIDVIDQWRTAITDAAGDRLTVTGEDSAGWTWARVAANGAVVAVADQPYTREADAWRGAHRANPDLVNPFTTASPELAP